MSVTGCPTDYRVGFHAILWMVFIVLSLILAFFFIIQLFRTQLRNRKELYFGAGIFNLGSGLGHLFIQIGVFQIENYIFFLSISQVIAWIGFIPFIYYWEKNLMNLKKIPTLFCIIPSFLAMINLIYFLFQNNIIFEIYVSFMLILGAIALLFILILIFKFITNVVGKLRFYGQLLFFGFIIYIFAAFLDHPPGCSNIPLSSFLSPTFFILGGITSAYALIRIVDGITLYYQQAQICTIHKGKIKEGDKIYYCPSCTTIYCQRCYEAVIKREGCWNCQEFGKDDFEEKSDQEGTIIEIKEGKKPLEKSNSTKENLSNK